jgi:hypothetical protein
MTFSPSTNRISMSIQRMPIRRALLPSIAGSVAVFLLMTLVAASARPALGQTGSVGLTAERQPVELGIAPSYVQVDEAGNTLEQWSSRLWVSVPMGTSTQLWARTRMASTTATGRAGLDGWGDTQIGLATAWSVGGGSIAANLSTNVPTGRQQIRSDELETAVLIGQRPFEMDVASFGQGWSVSPGLTWAIALGEDVMLGVGGRYRYLGAYVPRTGDDETYTPGDEILLNAGFDVRLRPSTAWSLDAAYTLYGADEFAGVETFEPGDRWTVTTQVRSVQGRRDLRVLARYTGYGKGTLPPLPAAGLDAPLASDAAQTVQALPQSIAGTVDLYLPLGRALRLGLQAGGAYYDATDTTIGGAWDLSAERTVGRVGGGPEVRLGRTLVWHPQASYTFGSFTRFSAHFALYWRR